MIKPPTKTDKETKVKAVGLMSGGLDSALAAKIIFDLGVDVYGVHFRMPWDACDDTQVSEMAKNIGIRFTILRLDENYLEMVKKPKHGYGSALNPCTDCHAYMLKKAREYMEKIGADFVFTGEVLGQRPMSQMRRSLSIVEAESGLQGHLLRPLCAKLLEPTIAENEGRVDRNRLLALNGRSRQEQITLAEQYNIRGYRQPAGGCLLTDTNFAKRMKDAFCYGYRDFRDLVSLRWGRHFRLSPAIKAIMGRNEEENRSLSQFAHEDDFIFELPDKRGPTLIFKGKAEKENVLGIAAGLVQRFSKQNGEEPVDVDCWPVSNPENIKKIRATLVDKDQLAAMAL